MMEKNILCCTLLGGGPLSLNTEGVVRSRDEMVGCGGFIRDLRSRYELGYRWWDKHYPRWSIEQELKQMEDSFLEAWLNDDDLLNVKLIPEA